MEVNVRAYVLVAIYCKFEMSPFKYFTKMDLVNEAYQPTQATAMPKCRVGDLEGS